MEEILSYPVEPITLMEDTVPAKCVGEDKNRTEWSVLSLFGKYSILLLFSIFILRHGILFFFMLFASISLFVCLIASISGF